MSTPALVGDRAARRMPGEEGVWVFILGDMVVFALFFGVIVYLRGEDPGLFAQAQGQLSQTAGATNTVLLLTSSLFVALGVRAVRDRRRNRSRALFAVALLCGLCFAGVKALEYQDKIVAGLTPATNDFYMYFFVFTGIHLLHVTIGVAVLAALIRIARRPRLASHDISLIESGASYWHLVDLLWVVLFALFYLLA
jgi:nitric oxide reductase NorE protein